jgi:hypothetical protein
MGAKHFVQPRDGAKLVEIANAISKRVKRPIAYIHMPVPIDRNDDAFFRPLRDLRLQPGTELYLGLVHADGAAKVQARIDAAAKYVPEFGISTECGFARSRGTGLVKTLLKAHAQVSREPRATKRRPAARAKSKR